MKFFDIVCFILGTCPVLPITQSLHPLSDEFIDLINNHKSTWRAGRNFQNNTSLDQIKTLMGVRQRKFLRTSVETRNLVIHQGFEQIPINFDARERWPNCKSIQQVRDQSTCGSCWAFATVEAITDRICIHSNGTKQVSISAENLLTCCYNCGFGCSGGFPFVAWKYWVDTGITSGGAYNSTDGCQNYAFPSCEHHTTGSRPPCGSSKPTPPCKKVCDAGTNLNYNAELSFGKTAYSILPKENQIQLEILKNGPVGATYSVYEDFLSYKSGVYQHLEGELAGGHAVKIIGWGVENDTPYWLVANSWNEDWGSNGFFKILRGKNECGIEDQITAGLPKL